MLFPRPADLADADPNDTAAAIGMPTSRGATIRTLAAAVRDDPSLLEPGLDLEEAVACLTALPGIGDWTARYVAMRCLGEPDAFPAGDLVLRKVLADGDRPLTPTAVRSRAEAWRPWRAYAAVLLWRESASPTEERS